MEKAGGQALILAKSGSASLPQLFKGPLAKHPDSSASGRVLRGKDMAQSREERVGRRAGTGRALPRGASRSLVLFCESAAGSGGSPHPRHRA